jgi:hypothetical protein
LASEVTGEGWVKVAGGDAQAKSPFAAYADNSLAHVEKESPPLSDTTVQSREQRVANLTTLRRELEDMARKMKQSGGTPAEQSQDAPGLVLVIRGK